ncbi:EamA family transporter [Neptunicoccus cionae]|uniref:EamA family transporter n=1 Tax=Neptunicoccus cionae TaxID=2035344 RepID=UPI000C75D858|nr:EamA family transporter [Amylibacter cionae]PLS21972.1 multidrug transporter [Amylibacter cionae]
MTEWLLEVDGTQFGRNLALALAVLAAVLHAVFGALQKGKLDPWLARGAIDVSYSVMALPVILFLVPWPEPHVWPLLFGAMGIHLVYKFFQAMAYARGSYTVVYPVVRGMGPLVTMLFVGVLFQDRFHESYNLVQWSGVILLSSAIFLLAGINLMQGGIDRRTMGMGLFYAVLTGFGVAAYTTWDAYGVRATLNPFTFIFWLFFLDGLVFPWIAVYRYRKMAVQPSVRSMAVRGVIGGLVAFASFGSIMFATRLDKVGEVAVLRETSVVFAALIGWLFLHEKVGLLRATLMVAIAAGAVLVEFSG